MVYFLRGFFFLVLASMLAVTSWASWQCPLFGVPRDVATHPWFIATLFDAYWGFLTFYVWVAYKELSWISRIAWLVAILLLGNIAMAVYCLVELFRHKAGSPLAELLTERHTPPSWVGVVAATCGICAIFLAAGAA